MTSARIPEKPFAPSCERNREPLLAVLREWFAPCTRVLEIGSGTGQHAVYFAAALPHLTWQCSDRADQLPGIRLWLDEAALANTPAPLALDVERGPWPAQRFDAMFSANTAHIMSWDQIQALFAQLPQVLSAGAVFVLYGPFKRGGAHTSEGNAAFDAQLRAQTPHRGIRDVEALDTLARASGMQRIGDVAMPANNACLIWRRG
jgi:SAM-dependent methyltransferase